jgi:tRNA-dihydrouridine synthase C
MYNNPYIFLRSNVSQCMRIILAPMEGVLDACVRELLTAINDYDLCVTEFVRVTYTLLPKKTFYRLCPELQNGGKTLSGTPVRVQLLGQSPPWLAENAVRAVELGSPGVDLNCGCPAKTVVGSCGGASLLKDPELIYQVTKAIREAVPAPYPVTVKMRLGWDHSDQCVEIAEAIALAGATEIAVHGRTKEDGYKVERIDWEKIGAIRQRLRIPVIANGEIWDAEQAKRCREITGCQTLMVGRGALALPNLGNVVKHQQAKMPWPQVLLLLERYIKLDNGFNTGLYYVARIKQWVGAYLRKEYREAIPLFQTIRPMKSADEIAGALRQN